MPPTNPSNAARNAEALLEHAGWMRKLAQSLVGDAQRADDLAQDTWVRALQHPPRTDLPLRGWLATVMRNVWRQDRRGDARRSDRETRVAQAVGESGSSGDEDGLDLLERVSMQRQLVETVVELDEPYRTTVLLRYFEELSPQAISKRQDIPVSTVKTRLARGLERLRARLDAKHGGDGNGWMLALVPVLRPPAGLETAAGLSHLSLGALVVNTKLLTAVVALGVVGAAAYLTRDAAELAQPSGAAAAAPSLSAALGEAIDPESTADPIPLETTDGLREALPLATARDAETAVPIVAERVRGRVVDVAGRSVGDVAVVEFGADGVELGRTLGDGSFLLPAEGASSLAVDDPRYATVMTARPVDEGMGKEVVIVVAPRIRISGHVLDEFGTPVSDARVALTTPPNFRADLGWVLDFSFELSVGTASGEDGAFAFESFPSIPGATLTAKKSGYWEASQDSPENDRGDLVLVLDRPSLEGSLLSGVVIDPSGFPVAGATVSHGIDTQVTDESGSFAFDLSDPDSFNARLSEFVQVEGSLLAVKPGFLPGELKARATDVDGKPIWPDHVVLRLGGEPLSVEGRVVDGEGRPLADRRVWLEEPTFLGGRIREGRSWPSMTHVESELSGLDSGWPFVVTRSDGTFRLDGLLDREYTLEAMDPTTLMRSRTPGVRGGSKGVELQLLFGEAFEVIRGRVVDSRGEPVVGASVGTTCDAFQTRVQGQVVGTRHARGAEIETDAEGHFEFEDVPKDLVYFRVDHPDIVPFETGRSEQSLRSIVGEDHEDFTLRVMRRCHFQIELADASDADEFEMLDADGEVLQLSQFEGNGRRDGSRFPLIDGRTNLLAVGDRAATLVLYRRGKEVQRVPVSLTAGEQPTIRP